MLLCWCWDLTGQLTGADRLIAFGEGSELVGVLHSLLSEEAELSKGLLETTLALLAEVVEEEMLLDNLEVRTANSASIRSTL